jgi:hypothetical protein
MATPRINGTLAPVRTQLRTQFDPTRGFTVTQEFESAGDNLAGLAKTAQDQQIEYSHTPNMCKSRLLLTASGAAAGYPDTVTNTWQLLANQISRDIKDHPAVLAFPQSGNGSLSQTIKFVEDFKAGTPPPDANPPDDLGGFWSLQQFYLYRLLIHGVTSYVVDQHVVRHTVNVPIAYAGVIGSAPIPGLMVNLLNDINVNGPDDGVQFKWGWRRTGFQYSVSANNRVEVVAEWALASWPLLIYSIESIMGIPS